MSAREIAIYGAGGFAREVAWLLERRAEHDNVEILGFVQDGVPTSPILNGLPVMIVDEVRRRHPGAAFVVAVGDPKTRRAMVERQSGHGLAFPPVIASSAELSSTVNLGQGVIICAGCILTVNIEIGNHVHINLDCTIGHDVRIGDFTTLAPGVHVSGNVHIGEGVYVGTGATIINGHEGVPLVIADGCLIAAGACITKSTEPFSLYAGVPAVAKKRIEP